MEQTQKQNIMTTATITKTITKVNAQPTEYSLGYRRLSSLPTNTRKNFDTAAALKTNFDLAKAHEYQKNFLESLNGEEFFNWLKSN